MSNESGAPQGNPGDIVNWPMLKIVYRTDPDKVAALLPPGIEPGANPHVTLTIYNYPVPDEPEYGIVTTVDASYNGIEGEYTLGYGIDQESAIFISQETNGQPKYPCTTEYYRLGPQVTARCTHQGYTFVEFKGVSTGPSEMPDDFDQHEWWIKGSRAEVQGELILRDSPWDPLATLLPMREQLSAHLWWPTFLDREIKLAGKLDPEAFLPFVDTISGSRWPGENGGPKRS